MTNKYLYITILAVLGFNAEAQSQESDNVPRLVVNIVIDQLRSDYLEAFMPLYTEKGFKRMMSEGRIYANASYPFSPVDRASAVAAIGSGVTPYYNNIVGERWLNRKTLRPLFCTDDPKFSGLSTRQTASPNQLLTSVLGDELKVATGGRAVVCAVAPFCDAAVLSAGLMAPCGLTTRVVSGALQPISMLLCLRGSAHITDCRHPITKYKVLLGNQ